MCFVGAASVCFVEGGFHLDILDSVLQISKALGRAALEEAVDEVDGVLRHVRRKVYLVRQVHNTLRNAKPIRPCQLEAGRVTKVSRSARPESRQGDETVIYFPINLIPI